MPKISALPVVTSVTEATDKLVVVASGVTSAITADNVAADSAFTSRYVAVPTAFTAPTLTNSWANNGGGEREARHRLEGTRVHLEGMLKDGVVGSSMFTLPAGQRPPVDVYFPVLSNNLLGILKVGADGTVILVVGSNVSVHLNGVSFSVTS